MGNGGGLPAPCGRAARLGLPAPSGYLIRDAGLWTPQIAFDRHPFFGVEPTVWLQSHLRYGTPRWWDVPVTICYLSFFVLPLSLAVVLWLRSRVDYYCWAGRYFALSFIAFACFAVFPTAPPWAAASCSAVDVATCPTNPPCMYEPPWVRHGGLLGAFPFSHSGVTPYVQKNATAGLSELHLTVAQRLIEHGNRTVDLMAAVPSLHAGASMLIAIFLWYRVRRPWRVLLAAYPLFMGFTHRVFRRPLRIRHPVGMGRRRPGMHRRGAVGASTARQRNVTQIAQLHLAGRGRRAIET